MKKLLLLAVITVLGFANVNAQEINFGIKAGISFADISGDNPAEIGPITDFKSFGILAEIPVSEKFSFQPELMYSGQGFEIDDEVVLLDYLNLPLMGKYYLTKGLSLEAGPQIGFMVSADREGTDIKDTLNSVDFGVNFGIGYKLNNGLNFGIRYNAGLSDISEDGAKDRNSVSQLYFGYFF